MFSKVHNKYTNIEMLVLIRFLFILADICHKGLFQQTFKLRPFSRQKIDVISSEFCCEELN